MARKLSIQAYTVRDFLTTKEQMLDTFKNLASFGYTGLHTAGDYDLGYDVYKQCADEAGLEIVGTHVPFQMFSDIDETVRIHKLLDTNLAGVGGMPNDEGRHDVKVLSKYIDDVNKIAEQLAKHGMKFTYHNHSFEFGKIGNDMIFEVMEREFDPKNVSFVLDTCWVAHGGQSNYEWMEKLAGRIDILHIKDRGMSTLNLDMNVKELGKGNLNFPRIIKHAEDLGIKHLCYEQDFNFEVDALKSAKDSAEYFFSIK